MKILLLEDDFSLNKVITSYLRSQGFFVNAYTNGDEAVKQLLQAQYDLCILDINVPHIDGHAVLDFLRKENIRTPVIMMSAMKDMETIKKSYENGCDDYLKKPFEIEELMLRIRYALKHALPQVMDLVPLKYGYFFDPHAMILTKNDSAIDLSSKEQLMLALFVSNQGRTVSTEMLRNYVWNGENVEAVSMRTIVHKLKTKLKSGMIINLRGVGYKLLET
ncbi:response regulator transcription factor [Sulfurovum sp.]|uniref:response regulator transcription factor n=1 Tax=Sulfurovum sp. TaxID=1969726 RepID=UPI00356302DD